MDNHCRSAHLCCWDSITRNNRVFPPLHPLSVRHTRRHITACIVCGRQFTITTHCRSVKFMMSFLALKIGDHSPNFELWCLVLSVELIWYIQSSQLQHVLSVNNSNISIQQYQSTISFKWVQLPMHMAIMISFLKKHPRLAVCFEKGHFANSWSYDGINGVTMVNKKNIMSWSYIQSTTPPYRSGFRTIRLGIEIWPL